MGSKGGRGRDGQWYGMVGYRGWFDFGSESCLLLFGGDGVGSNWGIICGLGLLGVVVGLCCGLNRELCWLLVGCMNEYCFCRGVICGVPLSYCMCLRIPGYKRHFQLGE